MRRPIQCEGIERGPQRAAKIGVAGSVQPQQFSDIWPLPRPIYVTDLSGAVQGAFSG